MTGSSSKNSRPLGIGNFNNEIYAINKPLLNFQYILVYTSYVIDVLVNLNAKIEMLHNNQLNSETKA